MKRLINIILLSVILTIFSAPLTAKAYTALAPHPDHNVTDYAGLLSKTEYDMLDKHLKDLSAKHNFDIVVVTTHDLDGKTPMEYCDDFYDYGGYGLDERFSGICFLRYITEDGSDYEVWISATGKGEDIFQTQGDFDYLIDQVADDIIAGRYYSAFYDFGDVVASEYKSYYSYNPFWIFAGIGIGLIVAASAVGSMKRALKSVAPAGSAVEYIKLGSFKLLGKSDNFLYKNVTKTYVPPASSSGGHSTSHHSSSGRSHSGGGRHI